MLYLSKSTNVAYEYSSSVYYYNTKSSCCSLFHPVFDYNFPGSENCVFLCDVSDTSLPLFTKLSFDCHAVFVSSDQSKHKPVFVQIHIICHYGRSMKRSIAGKLFRIIWMTWSGNSELSVGGGILSIILADGETYMAINEQYNIDPVVIKKLVDRCNKGEVNLYDEEFSKRVQWLAIMEVAVGFDKKYVYRWASPSIMFEV